MPATNVKSFVGKVVILVWHDAYDRSSWTDIDDPVTPLGITQWGLLDRIENGYARVLYAHNTEGGMASFTAIPLGMIESIREAGKEPETSE